MSDGVGNIASLLSRLRANAHVPDSGFAFAALAECKNGAVFAGVNWETADRSLGTCAESAAMMNLLSCCGPAEVARIYLLGAEKNDISSGRTFLPCSECRQLSQELDPYGKARLARIPVSGSPEPEIALHTLLPTPFVFRNYIEDPLRQTLAPAAPAFLRGAEQVGGLGENVIVRELDNATARSFCPDGSYRQGAIITTPGGYAYCGSIFHTANFKSTKDALTAALSMMLTFDGIQEIQEAFFLHVESRRFCGEGPFFPHAMSILLPYFGCKRITIFHRRNDTLALRKTVKDMPTAVMAPGLFDGNAFRLPEKYRGL